MSVKIPPIMTEDLSNYPTPSEAFVIFDPQTETRAIMEQVTRFQKAYESFFHPKDANERNKPGSATLSSLDFLAHNGLTTVEYPMGGYTASLSYERIIKAYEELFAAELNSQMPLITFKEQGRLPSIKPPVSPKVGIMLNRELHMERKNFLLNPENGLERGIEQIKIALSRDEAKIGELWIGRKWHKNQSEDKIENKKHTLALTAL